MTASATGFRLVTTMRRGTIPGLREAWCAYGSLEDARTGGKKVLLHERVARVMIVSAEVPPSFVEWP